MDDTTNLKSLTSPLSHVPVEVRVSVGHARPTVQELLTLSHNDILTLNRKVSDPIELFVGDKLIAYGELEELEGENQGQLAIRLTSIVKADSSE